MTEANVPSKTIVETNQLVLPQHTNAYGTAFGGTIMSWVDICAALSAQRHSRMVVVTASFDRMDFLHPIKLGQLVSLRSMVNWVGRTSMEVGVRIEAEDMLSGARIHASSAYVTFVATDANGRPTPVRPLVPETDEEQLRWHEAEARRQQRLELADARRLLKERLAAKG